MISLNDVLCQIGKCIKYCQEFDRKLIIDTRKYSALQRDFSDYFIPKNSEIENFIQPALSDEEWGLISKIAVSKSNLSIDYDDEIILHQSLGGGLLSAYTLEFFKLNPNIAKLIQEKLSSMPDDYCSVFVRNTDVKTDYKKLFDRIKPEVGDRYLLLCTDDYHVIEYAKDIFPKLLFNDTLTKNEMPDISVSNNAQINLDKDKVNIEAITDLILGASSSQVFLSNESFYGKSNPKPYKSGFMLLGEHLNKNKNIITNLLT